MSHATLECHYTPCFFIFVIVATPFLAAIGAFMAPIARFSGENGFSQLVTLLAFIVALSSYLATVIREIVKLQTADNKLKSRKKIFMLAMAEISLVSLSLFVIARLLLLNVSNQLTTTLTPILDSFIMMYLALILLGLACLHARIWSVNLPWRVNKD